MKSPSEDTLVDAITTAVRAALSRLRSQYDETFYYCSLITTEEALAPGLCVSSEESLRRTILRMEGAGERELRDLRWSYADSPFYPWGEDLFESVSVLFMVRPQIDDFDFDTEEGVAGWEDEYELRLCAMERAMALLDREGLFGRGEARAAILVNAEVMPPTYLNVERALRLNPPEALAEWEADGFGGLE